MAVTVGLSDWLGENVTVENVTVESVGTDHPALSVDPSAAGLGAISPGEPQTVVFDVTKTTPSELFLTLNITGTVEGTPVSEEVSHSLQSGPQEDGQDTGEENAVSPGNQTITALEINQTSYDSDADTATVQGKVEFLDHNNDNKTCRRCWVAVYDEDAIADDYIDGTHTDANGEFEFTFDPSGWDPLGGNADVYVQIQSVNYATEVTDSSENTYAARTDTFDDVQRGETISWNWIRPANNNKAWQIANKTLTARNYILDTTGWARESIQVRWPDGNWPVWTSRDEHIEIPSGFRPDGTTIYHEYGHAAMYKMYGNSIPDGQDYNCHFIFSETDPEFAVTEGWAAFLEGAVSGNPDAVRDLGENLETNEWFNKSRPSQTCPNGDPAPGSDAGDMDGNSVEGSAASIWWDIIDSGHANDESMEYSFNAVFQTMKDNNVQSMNEFFDEWDDGSRHELRKTYYRYGIDRNAEPSVQPPTPPSADEENYAYPSGWIDPPSCCGITVSTDASDPNGVIEDVTFYYSTDGGDSWTEIGTDTDGSDGWGVRWDDSITITQEGVQVKAVVDDGMETDVATSSSWNLDNSRPEFPQNLEASASGYTDQTEITFSWEKPSDDGSGIAGYYYELNSENPDNEITDPSETSKQYSDLSNGEHTFYVTSYDGVRLDNGPVEATVKIDTIPPATTHDAVTSEWTNDETVTIDATDRIGSSASISPAGVEHVAWNLDGTTDQDSSGSHEFDLSDGKHDLEFWAVDSAGSGNEEPHNSIEVWVDTTDPETTADVETDSDSAAVTLSASDGTSGVETTRYRINGGSWQTYDGAFTVDDSGESTLEFYSVDRAGNEEPVREITVGSENEPPTANDVSVSTAAGESVSGTFEASDPDDDSLTYSVVEGPSDGTVEIAGSEFTYTPSSGFVGSDSFTYRVDDGNGGSDTAVVSVEITEADEATFNITEMDPSRVTGTPGQEITVTATVENTGEAAGTQEIAFLLDSEPLESTELTLDPGESDTVSFDLTAPENAGTFTYATESTDDRREGTLTVQSSDGGASVLLRPASTELSPGETETFEVVVESENGVGAYQINLTTNDTSVTEITGYDLTGETLNNSVLSEDGSTLSLSAAMLEAHASGEAVIAQMTVEAGEEGGAALGVADVAISDQNSERYEIGTLQGAEIAVSEAEGPPPIVGDDPPTDPDDDGFYEDVNGDGGFDIFDVRVLYENLDKAVVQENAQYFNFDGQDEGEVNIFDVRTLFDELL